MRKTTPLFVWLSWMVFDEVFSCLLFWIFLFRISSIILGIVMAFGNDTHRISIRFPFPKHSIHVALFIIPIHFSIALYVSLLFLII